MERHSSWPVLRERQHMAAAAASQRLELQVHELNIKLDSVIAELGGIKEILLACRIGDHFSLEP